MFRLDLKDLLLRLNIWAILLGLGIGIVTAIISVSLNPSWGQNYLALIAIFGISFGAVTNILKNARDLYLLPKSPVSTVKGTYMSSSTPTSTPIPSPASYSCFISYSSQDETFAQQLHSDLTKNGIKTWFAPHDMKIGSKIRQTIHDAISDYDKVLLVLSQNSIQSDWVETEVESGFAKEKALKTKGMANRFVLFPIRLDEAVMNTTEAWAADIRNSRHIGEFANWKDPSEYHKSLSRLLRDLNI